MSRIELKGNISGTGTVTIESPNTNADSTIVLPSGGGQMVAVDPGTAGNVLVSTGTAWASQANPPEFTSGTVMLFGQTAAPTGWTKDTTNYNNSGIRVVTGTAATGGTVDFTTAFASQTPSGTINVGGLSAGATTLTTAQMPSHSHTFAGGIDASAGGNFPNTGNANNTTPTTNSTGGGGSHSHSISGSATFTGSAINLAVKYVDVIRATKD